jgi:adenosylcobinamide-phosphate synthase
MRTDRSAVIGLALLFDALLGDPPNRFHPVAWMGSAIAATKRHAPERGNGWRFAYGAALDVTGMCLAAGIGYVLTRLLALLPAPLRWSGEAVVLKMVFSLRGLGAAAGQVEAALGANDLAEARRLVSWHLVSRDTSALDASQVTAATVESVAENTSDGVIAPLFYYALGGLPAALAYRFCNTADSMLGYRDPEHEWLGKAPARLDDAANLIPARLTALLFIMASFWGADARRARRVWWRDRRKTASPNAGHPMSAMAGALGVELEKVDCYCLGQGQRAATAADVGRSVRLMRIAALLGGGLLIGLPFLFRLLRRRSRDGR